MHSQSVIPIAPRRPIVELAGKLFCTRHGEVLEWDSRLGYVCVTCVAPKDKK